MANDLVKRDAVYTQLYFEMRRYRDYELTAATWWTALLLAILSGLIWIFANSGSAQNILYQPIQKCWIKLILTILLFLLGLGILHALHYTNLRYDLLRAFCDKELEPPYSLKLKDVIKKKIWTPLHTIICTIGGLLFLIIFVLWLPRWACGSVIGVAWLILTWSYWCWHHKEKSNLVRELEQKANS